jgi:hypothetical protein
MSEQTELPVEPGMDAGADAVAATTPPKPKYPFSVLRVLATALRVTKHNFVPFFLLACVLELPVILLQLGGATEDVLLALLVQIVMNALMQAVVVYGVIMELQGSRPSTRTCIATGFAQVGRVLGVTFVSTLAMAGAMLLLVVPGIIVALMFYVIVPVTLVEGLGIRAAMKRSRELTHGRKGDLFLILIVGAVIGIPIELFAQSELSHTAALVWRALGSALTTMFFAVTVGVAYFELRKLRDGTHVPELATAFARVRK